MGRKARIGFTSDFLDKEGKFVLPGPGVKLLEEMSDVEREVFSEFLPEVTPEQIKGFDMVISRTFPRWTERSFIENDRLLSIHRNGVGYDRIDIPALTNAGVMLCITFILALSTRLLDHVGKMSAIWKNLRVSRRGLEPLTC